MKRLRLVVSFLVVAALLVASLLRSLGYFSDDVYRLQEDLGGDKVIHCLMGFSLMVSGLLVVMPRTLKSLIKVLFVVIALLTLEELTQFLVKTRHFDLFDLGMGVIGAIVVAALFGFVRRVSYHGVAECAGPDGT